MKSESLEALAVALGLPDFDLLLVGDGSGTRLGNACGWHCSLCDFKKQTVESLSGGVTSGTNNYAELAPYLHALWYYHTATFGNAGDTPRTPIRVVVVSDSEVTVRCGNGQYARRANSCLWAGINWFEENGYQIFWKHVPRNSNEFSKRADKIAGVARKKMMEVIRGDENA